MRYALFLCAFLCAGCEIYGDTAEMIVGADAGILPATGGPGTAGEPRSAGFYGLRLRLPFPAGETRVFTRGYETGIPGEETTHTDYGLPHMDDRFAIDLAGEGCSSWRAPVLAAASGVVFFNGDHGYGNNLLLDLGNGCETHNAHLDEIVVADGEWVHQGQLLGYEGNTGHAIGTVCAAHPGTHDHFKLMCHGEAVLPEPISGYWGLRGREGATLVSDNVGFARHPPGTLVKTRDSPRVYLIDDGNQLRWLATEDDLRSRRLFRDPGDPFGLVVTVSAEEFSCYGRGPVFDWPVTMRVTRCADGDNYLAVDDRGDRRRFWIPGTPGSPLFRTLIASWGFRESEVVEAHAGCGYPLADASLYLRDGTIVRDGGSYAYVAHGSLSYAVRPEMLWALGYAPDDVLEIPSGSLDALTRGPDSSHPNLEWDELAGCGGALPPPRVPTGDGDVFGGFGGALSDMVAPEVPDAGMPTTLDAGAMPGSPDAGPPMPTCTPSVETCNGFDDDCDGFIDNGGVCDPPPICAGGTDRSCSTSCGSIGSQHCYSDGHDWAPCWPPDESCNGRDDDCDGTVDEVCATPPTDSGPPPMPDAGSPSAPDAGRTSCGHAVRVRFSAYAGSWSFGSGFGTAHPSYEGVTGAVDRSWSCVAPGWLLLNGSFPGGAWMCGEWPAGTFQVPYGLPEVTVDGAPATVTPWHNPAIPGGVGCDLRICVGTCR